MIGRPPPAYEKSVFINCPFDLEYRNLMLANVFSVSAHGFVPRSARETQGDAAPRFSRIFNHNRRFQVLHSRLVAFHG